VPLAHQSRPPQNAEVTRYRRPADRKLTRKITGRAFAAPQDIEDGATRRIGNRAEGVAGAGVGTRNHMVTLMLIQLDGKVD
jgi:hypothetical protein